MRIHALVGLAAFGLTLAHFTGCARAQDNQFVRSQKASFRVVPVATGLRNPWGLVKLPDGRFLVTERPGTLRVIGAGGQLQPEPVRGIPAVYARGQGGLLDIQLHPKYSNNGWIYLAYSDPGPGGTGLTKIIRGRLKANEFADQQVIFQAPAEDYSSGPVHFGCRMTFDADGYLFFSIGERGAMLNAQNLANVKGKIHRLHDDGRVPADNPFVKTDGARPSIWAYGNRNPQGLIIHPETGVLWETEHGPRGGDELNIIKRRANYGWPVITYGIDYDGSIISKKTHEPGMEQPVIHWTPSIAVAGLGIYLGQGFPQWRGNLFAAALAHMKLVRLEMRGNEVAGQEILLERSGRIRDVRWFPGDDALYVVYDEPGKVVKLIPAEK
ncbi:MAG: PQQ-dependent sugar dehydrogenase [Verrucomicrobia bacterium]|nr:PQQ-dependent sugar dehydrogenase [Verrucomicrobiota bacterium]